LDDAGLGRRWALERRGWVFRAGSGSDRVVVAERGERRLLDTSEASLLRRLESIEGSGG
jgi:hypothetical protein